ncbi:hypothetical protein BJY01DRAFT_255953 [Aspergillus pseudoustus]|uniref:Nephrocystin 3-like N-terminal domain-containing protein n=1 Tax=Aspergillus pseudoustus TaxID=1810923 RepID=A0ABR4IFP9_9EURO
MAFTHDDYTVAWICALPLEMAAAKLMLEKVHPVLSQPQTDHNVYTLGSVSGHHVAIACLPSGVYGTTSAAIALDQMLATFPGLRFGLMVGVGGGVPSAGAGAGKTDIRLGDVVVSMPTSGSTAGGVLQYDFGKTLADGSFRQTGSLNKPPRYLLTAISQMRSDELVGKSSSLIDGTIADVLQKDERVRDRFSRPENDLLFKPSYHHVQSEDMDCSSCDRTELEVREPRHSRRPGIHYGIIASGNQVVKDPQRRDALAQEMDILCFEMEAAGLMDQLGCLVIRGISDYCDSHKHKEWQGYAALTAAAYATSLLRVVPSPNREERAGWIAPSPSNLERIKQILQPSVHPFDMCQSISKRRVTGTGDWVHNESLFQDWVQNDNKPLLWVSGTPGCGKSFIAQNIIAYAQKRFPQCDSTQTHYTSIGYFFFKHNDPETRKFHRALRDIAFQIYQNDPSYRDYVHAHCHSTEDIKSIHACWRVLFMEYYFNARHSVKSKVIIVLDGVDEAFKDDYREFLRLASDIVHDSAMSSLKIVLLGRPDIHDDLLEALEQPIPTIHVNAKKNIGDITTYVRNAMRKSRQISRVPKPQRLLIENDLITKAEGMFLWVDLMLTDLGGKTRAGSMLESLQKAPKGLDPMLRHVLETFSARLNDEEIIDLNIILAWVACAARPLTLRELREIFRLELETTDERLGLEDALRTQYASLFVLNREHGLTTADLAMGDRRGSSQPRHDRLAENSDSSSEWEPEFKSDQYGTAVVFCHASIRDYLRNPDYGKVSAGDGSTPVGVDIGLASWSTLNMCLLAIAIGPVGSGVRDYALRNWVSQLRHLCKYLNRVSQQQRQETIVLLCQIFKEANLEMFYTYAAPEPVIEFINCETMHMVVSLFSDQECVDTIEETDTREWIRLCVLEPAQVFVPLGQEVARRWLIDIWDPVFCMITVLAVIFVIHGDDLGELTEAPVANTVLEVARWAQFNEDARWHHHVGACLSSLEHYDAAIEHLSTALALEPIWRAKRDLALVYWEQGRLDDSLRLLEECDREYTTLIVEKNNDSNKENNDNDEENNNNKSHHHWEDKRRDLAELRKKLGLLSIELGDHSNATKCLLRSIELWDYVYICDAVSLYIQVLIGSNLSREDMIMPVLKRIDRYPWSYDTTTALTKVLESNFKHWFNWDNNQRPLIFAVSAKRCNDIQWLESKYQSAIAERERLRADADVICLKESLAYLYDRFFDNGEKASPIWKDIVSQHRVPDSITYEVFCRGRNRAVAAYAYRLLTSALRAKGDPQASIITQLEQLCDTEIQSLSSDNVLFDGQPGVYMGVWHNLNGREQAARNYFRPYVLHALSWHIESIYDRIMSIQRVLGHLFAMVGHDEDAITLLQLVHSPLDLRDGTSASPEERMAAPWPLIVEDRVWYCHICLRSWGNFVDCNVCRHCKADICDKCLDSVKRGDPDSSHACDASHDWLHIPPPPGVPGTYELCRDGRVLSVEKFMDAIEKSWS